MQSDGLMHLKWHYFTTTGFTFSLPWCNLTWSLLTLLVLLVLLGHKLNQTVFHIHSFWYFSSPKQFILWFKHQRCLWGEALWSLFRGWTSFKAPPNAWTWKQTAKRDEVLTCKQAAETTSAPACIYQPTIPGGALPPSSIQFQSAQPPGSKFKFKVRQP